MNDTSETSSVRDYLNVLSAQRSLIIAVAGIAVAIGLAYSLVRTPVYEATATVEFRDESKDLGVFTPGVQIVPELRPDQAAAAAAETVTRDDVVRAVQGRISTGLEENEVRDAVSATVRPESNLVAITTKTEDADLSAQLANEFARQAQLSARESQRERYARDAKELQASLDPSLDPSTQGQYRSAIARLRTLSKVADPVQISRLASAPGSPASPKPLRDTMLALILGFLVGVGAAFLRNSLDRRITDSHAVQRELELPLVGYVRAAALGLAGMGSNGSGAVSEDDLESFRILRRNVDFLAGAGHISSLVVTSALPEEGKSTVAAWYAYVSAVAGRRTLLVECDLRRPVLAKRFGVEQAPGLTDYLSGGARPKDVLRSVPVQGREAVDVLPLIPAGDNVFQPTEAIGSEGFKGFVDQITRAYEIVVFDAAPLLPVGDTLELIPLVDAILFCVRVEQTTHEQARAAKQAMEHLPSKPTGLVITGVRAGSDDDYYGYYSYAPADPAASRAT